MRLPLARAVGRATGRALRARAAESHLVGGALAVAAVVGPLAGLLAGRALGPVLGPALDDVAVARAFVAGLVLTALSAGFALGVTVPGLASLGPQVAAAGATALDRAAAVLLWPLGLVLLVGLLALPAALPVVAATPGGVAALPALAVGVLGALCVGGAVAAGARCKGAARRGGMALAAGALASSLALPGAVTAGALGDRRDPVEAALVAAPGALLALVAWGLLVAHPTEGSVRAGRARRLPRSSLGAVPVAVARILTGRAELRAALGGGCLLGIAGLGLARVSAAPASSGILLGTSGAVLAAAPCGLAVGGAVREAAHVWRLAPGRALVAGGWLVASGAVMLTPVIVVCVAALLADRDAAEGAGVALALATGAWSAAVVAGTVVPWRADGMAEQAASLGAFAVLCAAISLTLAVVGPRLAGTGVPSALTACAVVVLLVAGALGSLVQLLARQD